MVQKRGRQEGGSAAQETADGREGTSGAHRELQRTKGLLGSAAASFVATPPPSECPTITT